MEPKLSNTNSSNSDNDEFFDWVSNENNKEPDNDSPFFLRSPELRKIKNKDVKIPSFAKHDSLPKEWNKKMSSKKIRYVRTGN